MDMAEFERRLTRIEDIEAIKPNVTMPFVNA